MTATPHVIESALLLLAVFLCGCVIGFFLRRLIRKRATAIPQAKTGKDDLKKIRGIGPKVEKLLHEEGVFRFEQIAEWDAQRIADLDARLALRGRIVRENWVEQARKLAQETA